MSIMPKLTTLPIILLLFMVPFITADIRNITISSDSRQEILFQDFGFSKSGHISISIHSATLSSIQNRSRLAFCILPEKSLVRDALRSECLLDVNVNDVHILFNFTQLTPPQNSFSQSYPITQPNDYSLYLINCQPKSPLTMSVTTEMYNLNAGHKNYQSTQSPTPIHYLVFAAIYFLYFNVWILVSIANNKTYFKTRLLMGGLILTKALCLICAAMEKEYLKATGTSHQWDVVFYVFQLIRVIVECSVIGAIGLSLPIIEGRITVPMIITLIVLMISLVIEIIFHIRLATIAETNKNWEPWHDYVPIYDALLPCFMFVPVFGVGCSMRNQNEVKQVFEPLFETCEGLVAVRIVTFGIAYLFKLIDEGTWMVMDETASLLFYVLCFAVFHFAIRGSVLYPLNGGQ